MGKFNLCPLDLIVLSTKIVYDRQGNREMLPRLKELQLITLI